MRMSRPFDRFAPAWQRAAHLSRTPAWVGATFYLLLVSTAIFILRSNWAYDDPFITYRYARNLASGLGFVYNPGEQTLSTTTPLFTLLLAAVSLLGGDIPRAANLIGAVSIAAGGLLLFDLAKVLKTPRVGWLALILYPSVPLLHTTIGSETPLYIALCLACFAAYLRFAYTGLALLAALVVLTRPDGILVVGLLALHFVFTSRHAGRHAGRPASRSAGFPLKPALLFVSILLAWVIFAWPYFGSPLPATLAAKQHQGMMVISQRFLQGLFQQVKGELSRPAGLVQAGLALTGVVFVFCCARQWALFLAWPLVYLLAYSALGVTTYFWYYAPLAPGYVALVGLGVEGLYVGGDSVLKRAPGNLSKWSPAFKAGLVIVILAVTALQLNTAIAASRVPDPRREVYRDLGRWLNAHTPPDATVSALEIGIIGYYADRRMIDFAGLIRPDVAQYLAHHTTYMDAAEYVIQRYQPGFLVLNSGPYPDMLDSYLRSTCHRVERFLGARYGYGAAIDVFDCRAP